MKRSLEMKRQTVSTLSQTATENTAGAPLPECSHGVALKFTREDKASGKSRDFYACSANRDRKVCSLFHWVEDWERKLKRGNKVVVLEGLPPREKKSRPDETLGINAFTDNASNAQFLFDKSSIEVIVAPIVAQCAKSPNARALCIGTPSIHRALLKVGIDSVLLDEDERLDTVLPNSQRFNVFNGNTYGKTLPEDDFAVIAMDPPFHPELLGALFSTVNDKFPKSSKNLILFAFPCFFKEKVLAANPALSMSDVRLTYRNHKKYVSAERSPVRLYSSTVLSAITPSLNESAQYRICADCGDFRHVSNHHCKECGTCTTVAGKQRYVHCKACATCVKPQATHCKECKRCFLSPHPHERRLD